MENPTGYNAAFIKTKQLAKGAEILVTRSGGVIPKILSTIKPAVSEEQTAMWNELSICPSCGAPTAWEWYNGRTMLYQPRLSGKKTGENHPFLYRFRSREYGRGKLCKTV